MAMKNNMDRKMRQLTDNIHGTIYLSELESELISTPTFYRLHDIYQSSTVYMTFPSNRTKRYEHSLGVMEIAGQMLFSSVSNASQTTREHLFHRLKKKFKEIFTTVINDNGSKSGNYYTTVRKYVDDYFSDVHIDENIDTVFENFLKDNVSKAVADGIFSDHALDQNQFYQFRTDVTGGNDSPVTDDDPLNSAHYENYFFYRCLLQAVRIVALFHDVGHPPYSHILESVLTDLYKESKLDDSKEPDKQEWNSEKKKVFQDCLKRFVPGKDTEPFKSQMIYTDKPSEENALHENISVYLLRMTIDQVIPDFIEKSVAEKQDSLDLQKAIIFYYVFVAELAMAIFVDRDTFFSSIHMIVAGYVDADRLDYVMRDSFNSGVDWGRIPYKRIINSARMYEIHIDDEVIDKQHQSETAFIIAYPYKVHEDIDDFLKTRYKIFSRINFQHRCVRTSMTLQGSVRQLAELYLKSSSESEVISEIKNLWLPLSSRLGSRDSRIIKWNDSWLITTLHEALVSLKEFQKDIVDNSKNKENDLDELKKLSDNLEEFLMNRKKYVSIIKRGRDSTKLAEMILNEAGITREVLDQTEKKERVKFYSHQVNLDEKETEEEKDKVITEDKHFDAAEALVRIKELKDFLVTGSFELLSNSNTGDKHGIEDSVKEALEDLKKEKKILDYQTYTNKGRNKLGLPSHKNDLEEIYLYVDNSEEPEKYVDDSLSNQIKLMQNEVPTNYIYFIPPADCSDIEELKKEVKEAIAKKVASDIEPRYSKLFPHSGETKISSENS